VAWPCRSISGRTLARLGAGLVGTGFLPGPGGEAGSRGGSPGRWS